ncbi:MAG: alpha-amylase family glycosyl hydrolase [Chloroflexaceae bacterium]
MEKQWNDAVRMEFHVSRKARDRYQFDESLFAFSGNVIFANFRAARVFAQKMNEQRDILNHPEQAVQASHINAMGLIDEILHYVVALYRQQKNPQVLKQALEWLNGRFGQEHIDKVLYTFADEFPPLRVYRGEIALDAYMQGETAGVPHTQVEKEELLLLWLANMNPAFAPYLELFDDARLDAETVYPDVWGSLREFFETQPRFGPENQNLIDMLRAPALAHPHSLFDQLEYLRTRWADVIGEFLYRLLSSLDFIREDARMFHPASLDPGPSLVPDYGTLDVEYERFSVDLDWMPRLVLLAKNIYVWLDQISKQYQRQLTRLDEVPDEELDRLARSGFSGLWLIGIWQRSPASQRIKQMCGNPEAEASAYSLFDYVISPLLGGEEAFQNLKDRAWRRGIRMSSDMVPNHMGIDSKWVVEHPDWFISLDYSPFPAYSFNGPDLSWDGRVGIYLEDHYYSRSDAAVVFKRVDHWTGDTKYIYHGNDGTSMPWNDTAQLNFLIPEVREAVIQTILHVARKTPVIRFDAAMTLAKRHYQRLWFPQPGTGGDIASRSDHGLTKEQFDAAIPHEFWREVVDRVAVEAPDTLLLAEAFWLMEGYFVRTLGMHRVYNSAFMNMMRDEDNAKYRSVMKNTLEFDPEVLKRFVNFMNNPDERTAVDQFGKSDKYFGVCAMMCTMPGLPMFGHGQIEGYTEKYGMEYKRAYYDESPDWGLIQHHERVIFPLMHRRYIFAEVRDFLLYDCFAPEGHVNEDVFAYSNRHGSERGLFVYHNKFGHARGWIKSSVGYAVKNNGDRHITQRSIGEGLALNGDGAHYVIFRDYISGLEYIRNSKDLCEQGLYVELDAYQHHVFMDFREVRDNEWSHYYHIMTMLNGRGVPSVEETLKEVFLQPVREPFKALVNPEVFRRLIDAPVREPGKELDTALLEEVDQKFRTLLSAIKEFTNTTGDEEEIAQITRQRLEAVLQLPILEERFPMPKSRKYKTALKALDAHLNGDPAAWGTIFGWLFIAPLGKLVDAEDFEQQSRSWMDEWLLSKIVADTLQTLEVDEGAAWRSVGTIKIMIDHQRWFELDVPKKKRTYHVLEAGLRTNLVRQYLQINRHNNVLWFNKEAFDRWLAWMLLLAVVDSTTTPERPADTVTEEILDRYDVVQKLEQAEEQSEYQVEKLLAAVNGATTRKKTTETT